jgi:hypothetical protein
MNEVAILTCSRTDEQHPSLHLSITLLLSSLSNTAKYMADTNFNQSGSHIATITDNGHWTVFELSIRRKASSIVSVGSVPLFPLEKGEHRTGWWKLEWASNNDGLVIAESKGLHLVNVEVHSSIATLTQTGLSQTLFTPSAGDHFRGLAALSGLGGTVFAVLTTSEILIVDSTQLTLLLRQKHRRDRDTTLMMKTYSSQDGNQFLKC